MSLPRLAYGLGLAGLLPQIAVVAVIASGDPFGRYTALALGYAYAALILSFLGGLWWGLAAKADAPPRWLWFAAVAPSLVALASAWPWAVGLAWPGPSLVALGVALIAALAVDQALVRAGLAPAGWMALRLPLSLGLGVLTIVAGIA
ncbi:MULTISPECIES: DUF3429 domain-containing protein [unclassified Sphingomonas]|uniref:DUF3429 domain-containing protein n=1 Tax=unclassified Sphingomonas TaxID=196159 RepID=UPI001F57D191|nr:MULTISPECIES: DUF3429 domain-containing protein [unclassified Sphingomonas]